MVYNLIHSIARIGGGTRVGCRAMLYREIASAVVRCGFRGVGKRQIHQVHTGGDKRRTPLAGY